MRRLIFAALLSGGILAGTPAQAGPAAGLLGAFFATFGPLGAPVVFFGRTLTLLQSFLFRAALGLALNALAPRPTDARGYQVTAFGSALDHQIIYGRAKVAGARVFDGATGNRNRFLHRVVAFAGHEVDAFEEVYLNDYKLTVDLETGAVTGAENGEETTSRYNNRVRIIARTGSDTQAAIPEMVAEIPQWTAAHRLRGIAYLYIRLEFDADVFPNGIPEITAVVKGRKVFDPRDDTTAWSDNPALCLRDYLVEGFGVAAIAGEIDDTRAQQAANICAEAVEAETRYTCNGAFLTSATPADILQALLTSMGGKLWFSQGKWRMKPAAHTASVLHLDENDLRGGLSVSTRHSRRDNFNAVKGKWRGADSNWQETDYKKVTDAAFVAADGGQEVVVDIDLPFTTSHLTAQRIARIALRSNREQITVQGRFGLRAFGVQVGDVVEISNTRFGWVEKLFEVVEWSFGLAEDLTLEVRATLRETSAAIYDETPGAVFESNNTTLGSPFFVPTVGIAATVDQQIIAEKVTNFILVDVTSSAPERVDRVEVQFRETGAPVWISVGTGELGRFEVIDVEPASYDLRARAISTFGLRGLWEVRPALTVTGKITPPSDVAALFADLSGGQVTLDWAPVEDADLSHYLVRHAREEGGASWANATTAAAKVPRPASEITLPVKPGTYMIRAQDKSGNGSTGTMSVVVPAAALQVFASTETIDENGIFAGASDGVTIGASDLRIAVTTTAPSDGTYDMPGVNNAGSVRRFRSRIDVTTARVDAATGEWDDIPGLFDQFPGAFDDWTGDVQFADTDVKTFISLTDDDPQFPVLPAADLSFDQGDTITGFDPDPDMSAATRSSPLFAKFHVAFPATPDGVIWEQGSAPAQPRGAYVGVTSGNLTFRAGDGSTLAGTDETAKFTIPAAPFAGKTGTLWVSISTSPARVRAWWKEDATDAVVLLGSDVAPDGFPLFFSLRIWASGNPGAIGKAEGAVPVGESTTTWASTISAAEFWIDTEAPAPAADWGPWQQVKAGEFFARAARYRVELRSTSPDVTPAVSRLTAIMEFD